VLIRRFAEGFPARHHAATLVFLSRNLPPRVILLPKQYWSNLRIKKNIEIQDYKVSQNVFS
jgi:hypothetical protein